jgi:hypothetical protein
MCIATYQESTHIFCEIPLTGFCRGTGYGAYPDRGAGAAEKKQQAIFTQVELLAEQNNLLRAQLEALGSSARLAAQ